MSLQFPFLQSYPTDKGIRKGYTVRSYLQYATDSRLAEYRLSRARATRAPRCRWWHARPAKALQYAAHAQAAGNCKTTYYDRPSTKRILPIVRIHAQERHLGGRQPVRAQEGGMLLPRLGAVAEEGLHNVWQVMVPPGAVNLEFVVAELGVATRIICICVDVGFRFIGRPAQPRADRACMRDVAS